MNRFISPLPLLLRLITGAAFTFAGIGKIGAATLATAAKPALLSASPALLQALFGALLPWIELSCGLLLLSGLPLQHIALQRAARILIGSVFVFAAIDKIYNPDAFAKNINNYHVLPYAALNIMALVLPWAELLAGAMLLAGVKIRASAALTSAMLFVFILAIIAAILRGYNINCGCFAENSPAAASEVSKVGWAKVLEDLRWLVASVYIFFITPTTEEKP